jgi:putative sigma-54 modulation protein
MKLTVTGRHFVVSDATRKLIAEKLDHLRVINNAIHSAQCTLSREQQLVVCELTVHASGDHVLHGVGSHAQIGPAVSAAVAKVKTQATRLADRWKSRRRSGAGKSAAMPEPAAVPDRARTRPKPQETAETAPRVIRSRGAALKPMSVDDAILALSSAPNPFLVFRQASSENVAILFRRPDGNYGLIEPEA